MLFGGISEVDISYSKFVQGNPVNFQLTFIVWRGIYKEGLSA